ncbi:hypothetical protein [uncultured Methanobrevibacter sp.]|uniref:hypothetical protein n=2 Tax=Methanobrevibacter sp. TaxID=66852 RepID=UPI0025E2F5E3|nr:hypothetical protein [uncultured Methanobrevibacter sp.]
MNTKVKHHKQMRYKNIAIQYLESTLTMTPPMEYIKVASRLFIKGKPPNPSHGNTMKNHNITSWT